MTTDERAPTEPESTIEQLAQDSRVLRRARMLPQDRQLTPEEIDNVKVDFKGWTKEHKLTLDDVSRSLGEEFPESAISKFLSGRRLSGEEKFARALNDLMERHAVAEETSPRGDYVEIGLAKKIIEVVRTTISGVGKGERAEGCFGLLRGPGGTGKTEALLAAKAVYTGSIYIRVCDDTRRAAGMMRELAEQLGLPTRKDRYDIGSSIRKRLMRSRRLLIIDEAHQLHKSGLEAIRDVVDVCKLPCVLSGSYEMDKLIVEKDLDLGQYNSRVVARLNIVDQTRRPKNPQPLYSREDIVKLYSRGQLKLTSDAYGLLDRIANAPGLGALRLCSQLLRVAARLPAIRSKGECCAKDLIRILRDLHDSAFAELLAVPTLEFQDRAAKVG